MASTRTSKQPFRVRWRNGLELGLIAALVVLFLNLLSWPFAIADESLDGSWQAILSYSMGHGLRFGEEVIFTYGPLGSLSSFSYSGYNHAGKYGFELFMRLCLVIFMFRFLPNLKPYAKVGCVFLYLFILQFLPDSYETFFFFGMLSWAATLLLERPSRKGRPWTLIAMGVAFIVTCSLVKFTLLLGGVFCLGVVCAYLIFQKRNAEAVALALGFAVGVLSFWILLGQRLGDIPQYLYGSYQVAKGYAMSMQIPMEPGVMKFFIFFLISSLALIAVVLREYLRGKLKWNRFKQPWFPLLLIYSGFLFMVWKQGVVRSDGHIWQFFCYVPLAAWFLYPVVRKKSSQMMFGSLMVVQLLLLVFAMETFYPGFLGQCPGRLWTHSGNGVNGLLKPSASMNELKGKMEGTGKSLVERYGILNQVGDRSIDMVGDHQGLVILPQLNYQPRPVFQSYVANNAYLQDLNLRYWEAGETPEMVIQSLDAIDGTLPTQSDSQTILHLLSHYQREGSSKNYVLLSKRSSGADVNRGEEREYDLRYGEATHFDSSRGEVLLARMHVPLNLMGRIRAFFFKPPLIQMSAELVDGSVHHYRFNPVTAERDFLFAPAIQSAPQLWDIREGKDFPGVVSLTLATGGWDELFLGDHPSMTITPIVWQDLP